MIRKNLLNYFKTFISFSKTLISNNLQTLKNHLFPNKIPNQTASKSLEIAPVFDSLKSSVYTISYIQNSEKTETSTLNPLEIVTSQTYLTTLNHILNSCTKTPNQLYILYTTIVMETDDTPIIRSLKSHKLNISSKENISKQLTNDIISLNETYNQVLIKTIAFTILKLQP